MKKWAKSHKQHQSSSVCGPFYNRAHSAERRVTFTTFWTSGLSGLKNTFVAKALELFLGMIVQEAANVTIERGSKRVETYHLYVCKINFYTFYLG